MTEEVIEKTGEKLDLRIREMLTELSKCGSRSLVRGGEPEKFMVTLPTVVKTVNPLGQCFIVKKYCM